MNYTIKNGDASLTVRDLGAEIVSLKYRGVEYIHQANKETWNRSAPYLFPNVGTINKGYKMINDHLVKMLKHGFLRDTLLPLTKKTTTELTFTYTHDKTTSLLFPYNFKLVVHYKLLNNSVKATITITNLDKCAMPFNFGLHPAFRIPLTDSEKFEDYLLVFPEERSYRLPTVVLDTGCVDYQTISKEYSNLIELVLNYDDYKNDALILDPFNLKTVTIKSNKSNYGVKFDFQSFKTLGIWTPNHVNAKFICIEPWVGCADAPNASDDFWDKKDVIRLEDGEVWQASYQITCLC